MALISCKNRGCSDVSLQKDTESCEVVSQKNAICSEAMLQKKAEDNVVVRLLDTMIWGNGAFYDRFEYDEKNRLVKIYHYSLGEHKRTSTLTYKGDDLVEIRAAWEYTTFARKGDHIIYSSYNADYNHIITVNNDGYIATHEMASHETKDVTIHAFQYQKGNMTKMTISHIDRRATDEKIFALKYDDKKSPLLHNQTPKWYFQYTSELVRDVGISNNITEIKRDDGWKRSFAYEYDSIGFPITRTMTETTARGDAKRTEAVRFTYRNSTAK
jgi:hypothetical protein